MSKEKYFNFPIQLIAGFMINSDKCLGEVIAYACYSHMINLEFGNDEDKMKSTHDYFNVSGSPVRHLVLGKQLFEKYQKCPMTGISTTMFWDYYSDGHKAEFSKICFLAFVALKSIIAAKPYCKIDNKYLLARMDGKVNSCEFEELTAEIKKYANEYQTKKIKKILSDEWYLKTYSFHTRGFYVSFTMSLEDLIFEAEKRREKTKDAIRKNEINVAREKALARLKKVPP